MRARLTYVPLEVAERFEGFIIQRDEQVLDAVRAKNKGLQHTIFIEITVSTKLKPNDIFRPVFKIKD
jgi:hypothetical protein